VAVQCYFLDEQNKPKLLSNKYWLVIALAFAFASADDTAMIHEHLKSIHRECSTLLGLHLPGLLGHWLTVYVPVLIIFSFATAAFFAGRLKGQNVTGVFIAFSFLLYAGSIGVNIVGHSPSLAHYVTDPPWLFRAAKVLEEMAEDVG